MVSVSLARAFGGVQILACLSALCAGQGTTTALTGPLSRNNIPTLEATPKTSPFVLNAASSSLENIVAAKPTIIQARDHSSSPGNPDDSSKTATLPAAASQSATTHQTTPAEYAAVAFGTAFGIAAVAAIVGFLVWRLRIRPARNRRRQQAESDVNWANMLKSIKSPVPYDIETPKSPSPSVNTRKSLPPPPTLQGLEKVHRTRPTTPSPLSAVEDQTFYAELDGTPTTEKDTTSFAVELEGCTPVSQNGIFVFPSPNQSRCQSPARVKSNKSGKAGWSSRRWSMDTAESPVLPPKETFARTPTSKF